MTIDWNWFFAAFAQCGAALIAIIGAFTISKLLGEAEKEEQNANAIDELIIHYSDIKKRISSRYFRWYDKQTIEYSHNLSDAIKNGDFNGLDDSEKLAKLLEIEFNLFGTDGCLEALNERIKKLAPKMSNLGNGFSMVQQLTEVNITPKGLWSSLSEEKEIIHSLQIESHTLIEKFKKAQKNLDAASRNLIPIRITIYILIVGMIITVIYPLHFMPLKLNETPNIEFSISVFFQLLFSMKGLLLFLLTLVIEGIFGYFLGLTIRIERKYSNTKERLLYEYFDIKSYSEYFK